MRIQKMLGVAAAMSLLAISGAALAATTLTLSGPITGNTVGPQSTSNPCIIAGTHCSQPDGMGYNNFKQTGNQTDYNAYSTTPTAELADGTAGTPYTVGQLATFVGSTFVVAIDINTADAGETLTLFEVIINGVQAYVYNGPTLLGNVNNNGNGYADWTLGLIDLSSYASTATVLFHAVWGGASDGAESFFIVPTRCVFDCGGSEAPEPASLALIGLAMAGLGLARRRRT